MDIYLSSLVEGYHFFLFSFNDKRREKKTKGTLVYSYLAKDLHLNNLRTCSLVLSKIPFFFCLLLKGILPQFIFIFTFFFFFFTEKQNKNNELKISCYSRVGLPGDS
jgi:hypothetical protein